MVKSFESLLQTQIAGITHVFLCINIRRVPRKMLEHEDTGRVLSLLPRDLTNVNIMKQICVMVILAYLYDSIKMIS